MIECENIPENVNISSSAQQRKHEYINKLKSVGTRNTVFSVRCSVLCIMVHWILYCKLFISFNTNKFESFFFIQLCLVVSHNLADSFGFSGSNIFLARTAFTEHIANLKWKTFFIQRKMENVKRIYGFMRYRSLFV